MSLTLAEARARAAAVSDVSYDLDLDLTDPAQGTYGCRAVVSFTCREPETFLELARAEDVVVELDGVRLDDACYDGRRIALTGLGGDHRVVVEARVPYVNDGDGMHLFTDPADGAVYASAYVGMDVAQKVLPCFDQNDLKAPVTLRVTADPTWTVLANGRTTASEGGRWEFATTPPVPVVMFVVCAGPWHSVTWEHAGLPFGWHARASLAAELDRDADELRRTTEACFDHYAEVFEEPYAFDSYDQVFAPGQNWGALETPGCVTYRDEYLPRGRLTDRMRASRATTIAHEMAHMWFGDLVTMTWWEDTWLQESFADMLGYTVAARAAGYPEALVTFESTRKATGYEADARRSTHPVAPDAEDVPDVDAAAGNFDMISYAKGNAVLRQLVTWLGEDTFLAGVNGYLARHRFGNATLADFLDALDAASDRDVRGWATAWLRSSGFDTVRVERDGDVPVLVREGTRPHRFTVTAYDDGLAPVGSRLVDLGADPVRLDDLAGRVVLPNSGGETFAALALDEASRAALAAGVSRLDDPLARAVVWGQLYDAVRTRALDPLDYLAVVADQLPAETAPTLVTSVLSRAHVKVLPHRVAAGDVPRAVALLDRTCLDGLARLDTAGAGAQGDAEGDPGGDAEGELRVAFCEALAASSRDAGLMRGWLDADAVFGLPLHAALRWRVVTRLAAIGEADAAFVEAERRRDGGVDGELGAVRALAARPSREAKEAAWAVMVEPDVANRRFEAAASGLWQPEQVDLLGPIVDRYLARGPEIAVRRGQAFSQVVGRAFPAIPLTPAQVADVAGVLAGDEVPAVLRRHWEDALDDVR